MLILVNLAAQHGRAEENIPKVIPELKRRFPELVMCAYHPPYDLDPAIRTELGVGSRQVISIGGDGTLNHVVNAIMRVAGGDATPVQLGAIGLGSSNDALKPVTGYLREFPARIDPSTARPVDLGRIRIRRVDGTRAEHYFIANAGLGAIAEANARYNNAGTFTRLLARVSVDLAIAWVAFRTIATWHGPEVELRCEDHDPDVIRLDTLSVAKIPWIAGSYHYDQETERDSGSFGVYVCDNVGRLGLIRLVSDLSKGRFLGPTGRSTQFARSVHVRAQQNISVEFDGDTDHGYDLQFDIVPRALHWMG